MNDVAERVARGAEWLDRKYPGWVDAIDVSILDVSDCHQCVLGQVYTGVIPTEERGQIMAQVSQIMADSSYKSSDYWADSVALWGGYSVLDTLHDLPGAGMCFGFIGRRNDDGDDLPDSALLTDEWTRVIIERRLRAHPDVNDLSCSLAELRVPATVG